MYVLNSYWDYYDLNYMNSDAIILLFENDSLINNWSYYNYGYYSEDTEELELLSGDYTLIYGNSNTYPSIGMSVTDAISQIFTNSYNFNSGSLDYAFQMELFSYDGTCDYPGCTDSNAFNYNPVAILDDGSCESVTELGTLECGIALSTALDTINGYYGYESFGDDYAAYSFSLDSTSYYIEISFEGFSASKNNNCAHTKDAMLSSIGPIKKIILSLSNLEYISKARSPLEVRSTTIGTSADLILSILSKPIFFKIVIHCLAYYIC